MRNRVNVRMYDLGGKVELQLLPTKINTPYLVTMTMMDHDDGVE